MTLKYILQIEISRTNLIQGQSTTYHQIRHQPQVGYNQGAAIEIGELKIFPGEI